MDKYDRDALVGGCVVQAALGALAVSGTMGVWHGAGWGLLTAGFFLLGYSIIAAVLVWRCK